MLVFEFMLKNMTKVKETFVRTFLILLWHYWFSFTEMNNSLTIRSALPQFCVMHNIMIIHFNLIAWLILSSFIQPNTKLNFDFYSVFKMYILSSAFTLSYQYDIFRYGVGKSGSLAYHPIVFPPHSFKPLAQWDHCLTKSDHIGLGPYLSNLSGLWKKQESSRKTSISVLLAMTKLLTV